MSVAGALSRRVLYGSTVEVVSFEVDGSCSTAEVAVRFVGQVAARIRDGTEESNYVVGWDIGAAVGGLNEVEVAAGWLNLVIFVAVHAAIRLCASGSSMSSLCPYCSPQPSHRAPAVSRVTRRTAPQGQATGTVRAGRSPVICCSHWRQAR